MILIFLIVLIVALIIANILVSVSKRRKTIERAFVNPTLEYSNEVEVMPTKIDELRENNALLQGSLQATNRKLDMLNERVSLVEKIVMNMVQKKLDEDTDDENEN